MSRKKELALQAADLFKRACALPYGPESRMCLDQAFMLSQQIGDRQLQYRVDHQLSCCAAATGDIDAFLASFGRSVALHDSDPKHFPLKSAPSRYDLLEQFKILSEMLDGSSRYSLQQCDQLVADLEMHYRREGAPEAAIQTIRFKHAWTIGDIHQAQYWMSLLDQIPRDKKSQEVVSRLTDFATFAAETGHEASALRYVFEIVSSGSLLSDQPENAMSRILIPLLRSGQVVEARQWHLKSYGVVRNSPRNLVCALNSMLFCVVTGNYARALSIVENHLAWLTLPELKESECNDLLRTVGVVLASVQRAGYGDQQVRNTENPSLRRYFDVAPESSGVWRVDQLAPQVLSAAEQISEAFDARNGNSYVSNKIVDTWSLLDEYYNVPIHTNAFSPVVVPSDIEGLPLLDLASVYSAGGESLKAVDCARRALERGEPDPERQLELLSILLHEYADVSKDYEAVANVLPRHIKALRAVGRNALADAEESLGMTLYPKPPGDRLATLNRTVEFLPEGLTRCLVEVEIVNELTRRSGEYGFGVALGRVRDLVVSARQNALSDPVLCRELDGWMAEIYLKMRNFDDALERVTEVLREPKNDGCRAQMLDVRAQILNEKGRFIESARDFDDAAKIYASYRAQQRATELFALAGLEFFDGGYLERARQHFSSAYRMAELAGLPLSLLRAQVARSLLACGHLDEGVETCRRLLEQDNDAGSSMAYRRVIADLAEELSVAKRLPLALSMYQAALRMYEVSTDLEISVELMERMGEIQGKLGEAAECLATFDRAVELALQTSNAQLQVSVVKARALIKAKHGDESAMADIEYARRLAASYGGVNAMVLVELTETTGHVLRALGRAGEAVTTLLSAAEGYLECGDPAGSARTRLQVSEVYHDDLGERDAAIQSLVDACLHVDTARDHGAEVEDLRAGLLTTLANYLEEAGDIEEAKDVRGLIDYPA